MTSNRAIVLHMAKSEGYVLSHTGSGYEALRKDVGNDYILITDKSGLAIDSDFDAPEWVVGRYSNADDGDHNWTVVHEALSLEQALTVAEQIPTPDQIEKNVRRWSAIGVTIPVSH